MDTEERELTPRELDIIKAMESGCITDEEIAARLNITKNTVITHMCSIYSKFAIYGNQPRAKLVWEVMK